MSNVNKLCLTMFGALIVIMSASCSRHEGGQSDVPPMMSAKHCKQVDPASQAKLIAALDKVELGWTRTQVEGALGAPDFLESSANKLGNRSTGEALYYVVRSCAGQPKVGSGDEFVALLFNENGNLYVVEPERVPGVRRRIEQVSKWGFVQLMFFGCASCRVLSAVNVTS